MKIPNSPRLAEIFNVQTGNRRKEGTREKKKQLGGWRRYFHEHKKLKLPQKVTSEQQRNNERKPTKRQHSNNKHEQLKDTSRLRILYEISATTTKTHESLYKKGEQQRKRGG